MSYTFDHWMLDGVNIGSSNPVNITMNANHNLVAEFKRSPALNNPSAIVQSPSFNGTPALNKPTVTFS